MENPKILFEEHLKIYVLLKDKIIFESELAKHNIEYFCDLDNQPDIKNGIRYFIRNIDKEKLDTIFKENGIIASTETILVSDYRDTKKIYSIYLKVTLFVVLIMVLIIIVDYFSE